LPPSRKDWGARATFAALIPIRKSEAWWSLAQDERRALFEETSRHIAIGMEYLPGIARRLHRARELGEPLVESAAVFFSGLSLRFLCLLLFNVLFEKAGTEGNRGNEEENQQRL